MYNSNDIIEIVDASSGDIYVYEIEMDYDDGPTLSGLGPTVIEI